MRRTLLPPSSASLLTLTALSLASGCSNADPGELGPPRSIAAPPTGTPPSGNSNDSVTPPANANNPTPTPSQGNGNGGNQGSGPTGNTQGSGPTGSGNGSGPTGSGNDSGNDQGASDDAGAPAPSDDAGANGQFDQFQVHNLNVINMYRATLKIAPLVLDTQLSTFAIAGSQELSQDHSPHQHFINASNNGSIWMDGFNNAAAENQGDPNGWTVLSSDPTTNETDQIDQILAAMFAEGPGGGHYENLMGSQYTRLGVGLLEVSQALYLTNDFSP